ncbi:hypothetical protein CXG81DRAFT_1809, partial [Caulochytrium protostelioides]
LGHAVLCLDAMAARIGCLFSRWKLVPLGSFSRIERDADDAAHPHEDSLVLEFVGTGSITGMLYRNRKLDQALVALLDCIAQLAAYARRRGSQDGDRSAFRLPYPIEKDRVGDASVRMQGQSEAGWTRAMKYLLVDLQFCMAY